MEAASQSMHDLLRVGHFIPSTQDVTAIDSRTRVREALAIMRQQDFDQLPVRAGTRIIGVFSYRSLARSLLFLGKNEDPLEQLVEDVVEDYDFVRATQDVGPILEALKRDGAVLVGDEERLNAVMTLSDATGYPWELTRPFVLLQDIELAVRGLMREACGDEVECLAAVERAVSRDRRGGHSNLALGNLTLGELLTVLLNPQNYGATFAATFGANRKIAAAALEPVRDVRNKVFHFRDEITAEELDTLVQARIYLRRRIDSRKGRAG